MKISYKKGSVSKIKTRALVVNLFEDLDKKKNWLAGATAVIDRALGGYISQMIENKELTGKEEET
ncbi:MAG: hypothetical protein KKA19_07420, partial [Candidatus Margulisbacteria bacterium]|nr:hypothetical protein [Candidatus Margulisiibacteriota bacterium]